MCAIACYPTVLRTQPPSLSGSVERFSLAPHPFSATDTFPDETPTQRRHQPAGDSRFSDIEDGDSDDDSASQFSAPPASVGGAEMIPVATAPTAAGNLSAFFLRARRSDHHPQTAEAAGAPAPAPREPITAVSGGRALSADGRPHRGSDPTSTASRANFVILEVRDFAFLCGSKYASIDVKVAWHFVLGLYGALYTQNHENDVIFLNAQFNHRAHTSSALAA